MKDKLKDIFAIAITMILTSILLWIMIVNIYSPVSVYNYSPSFVVGLMAMGFVFCLCLFLFGLCYSSLKEIKPYVSKVEVIG